MRLLVRVLLVFAYLATAIAPAQAAARIKDVASLQAGRDNQLIGYGLVVGLQGSGDSLRSSPFTEQSLRAMLQNLGISTQGGQSRSKNIAAVLVTLFPTRRTIILPAAVLLIAAIGFSRVYLGVHWPFDVLAGFAAGVPLLVTTVHLLHMKNGLKMSVHDNDVNVYSPS